MEPTILETTSGKMRGGDAARVQELELELKNLRVAFEEYIGSSRELEDGLDRELADMRTCVMKKGNTF